MSQHNATKSNYVRNIENNVVQPEQVEIVDQDELDMFPDEPADMYINQINQEEDEEEEDGGINRSIKLEYEINDYGISICVQLKDWFSLATDVFTFDYETTEEEMTEKIVKFIDSHRRECETEDEYLEQEYLYMDFENSIREVTSIDFLDEYCKNTIMKSSRNC